MKIINNWKEDVFYLQGLLQQIYSDVNDSYESLNNHNKESQYQIALSFLTMSYQGYLAAKLFYKSNEDVQREEFEEYFKAFENVKFEMNKVISEKDTNTSWLISRLEQFNKSMRQVNSLIENLG